MMIRGMLAVTLLAILAVPGIAGASLTPIARADVVPNQRIEYGTTFNFGVVAFSKSGIDSVEFDISGQGYSGGTKTADRMTMNVRVASADFAGVYEYWVPISSNEFSSDGEISITPTIHGKDGGTRVLDTLTLIVEATNHGSHHEAWVDSVNGNDVTGEVGNSTRPYATIATAVSAAQAANGGISDGNIIYLEEGTYSLGGVSASTSSEWLTIEKAAGADRDNVIINSGRLYTEYLKLDSVTLQSTGGSQYVTSNDAANFWTNNCRRIGSGRYVSGSNPVHHSLAEGVGAHYSTGDYTYDADYGYRIAQLVRGATLEKIGNDAFENTRFVINARIDDINPGTTGWHADVYQVFSLGEASPPANNRIIYNLHATNCDPVGIFLRSDYGVSTDNAFVNCFVENKGNSPFAMGQAAGWDHLLIWHSTFQSEMSSLYSSMTNGSIMGNIFRMFYNNDGNLYDVNPNWTEYGNPGNNEFIYNHYYYVYGITQSCTPTAREDTNGWGCPRRYTKMPDSSEAENTASMGDNQLNLDNQSSNFGYPVNDSVIIVNRIPFSTIPADLYGNPRDLNPDVGAFEYASGTVPVCDNGICEAGEDCSTCPQDCTAGAGEVCCSGVIYTGDCCDDTYCVPPETCAGHACTPPECSNGIDDDGDGAADFPNDAGCANASGNDETDCGDGVCEGGETCGTADTPPECNDDCGACSPPVNTTITVDSTYSGYTIEPIDDGVIEPYGGTSTTWVSSESTTEPHWIEFQFSQPVAVNSVTIHWAFNDYRQKFMSSQEVYVQYWNDTTSMYSNSSVITNPVETRNSSAIFPQVTTAKLRLYQPANMGFADYPTVIWLTEVDYSFEAFHAADINSDGHVEIGELMDFIGRWKGNEVAITDLMDAIVLWRNE